MNFNKKVAFYTLGCKVNQYETESIKNQLMVVGYKIVEFDEVSDIYIINSCTVTSVADKKTRNMMRRAKKSNPNSILILTGCYAQTNSKELLEIAEVDYIIGNIDKRGIFNFVQELENKKMNKVQTNDIFQEEKYQEYEFSTFREMTRAYIKIQDGCDSFCSYCKIPFARGKSRSRKLESVIEEVEKVAKEGFKEVILIGINVGAYGNDFLEPISFEKMVKEVSEVKGIERIRFGSIYPDKITDEFIELFKNKKIMPHIHISLQSGDDTILEKMRRKYGASLIEERIYKLRKQVPKMEFSGDVIVGFPGETREMHENTKSIIKKINFQDLHVFQYSDRENTLAEKMSNKIETKIKKERALELEKLKKNMFNERRKEQLGEKTKVLIEEIRDGRALGYSENYLRVGIENEKLAVGKIYEVLIKNIEEEVLIGEEESNIY